MDKSPSINLLGLLKDVGVLSARLFRTYVCFMHITSDI